MRHEVMVGGMSESGYGLDTPRAMVAEGLGRYTVLFVGPWNDPAGLREFLDYARANKMRVVMDERVNRLTGEITDGYRRLEPAEWTRIAREYADVLDGELLMAEYSGLMLYWPAAYVETSRVRPDRTRDYARADAAMVGKLAEILARARREYGLVHPVSIDAAGAAARWFYRAGFERVDYEVTYTPEDEFHYAAAKGAALAYGRPRFGVDMAMVWYGGPQHDGLWRHRWRTSLFHAFIRGADPIYAEHGLMDYKALGKNLAADHPAVRDFRGQVGGLARLAAAHPRPDGFPKAALAVVAGRYDDYTGMEMQTHRWGQRDDEAMRQNAADRSWRLFEGFYRRRPWQDRYGAGEADYSGNPPWGQVDVVPAEAPATEGAGFDWSRYRALAFLGRHGMDGDCLRRLTEYVRNGGHLLMTAAHLDTAAHADAPYRPVNDGDLRELFGLRLAVDTANPARLRYGVKFVAEPAGYRFPLWSMTCDPKYSNGSFPMASLELDGAEVLAAGSERFIEIAKENDGGADSRGREIVLTGHRVGRGLALLVNSLAYPGDAALADFYADLLAFLAAAHQPELRVECSDRVRYAAYGDDGFTVVYLLNTEARLRQEARITAAGAGELQLTLSPGELRAVYYADGVLAAPENIEDRLTSLSLKDGAPIWTTLRPATAPIHFAVERDVEC